jgi:hypothetical protein
MLRPDQDRLNYGELLAPPPEYHLDFAIGTTYSLDLDALVGATMSLGLSAETDTNLAKNPVCLLEALKKTADKIALFCEAGQIHTPGNVTELYILLEKMVFSVALPGTKRNRNASFHPKFWLIRYENNNSEVMYRVVVLSRNLTFDRSWDVTYSMDAYPCNKEQEKNYPVSDFIRYLAKNWLPKDEYANEKRNRIYRICRELPYFQFEPTDYFTDFEFVPNNIPKYSGRDSEDESGKYYIEETPLFQESFHELLVMSPFLSKETLKKLHKENNFMKSQQYKLFTRKESLAKLNAEDFSDFAVYCLKDRVVQGEDLLSEEELTSEDTQTGVDAKERVSMIQRQDLHAKLYFARKGSFTRLYLGSLNASENGLNHNIEFMICLQDMMKYHNLKMDDLCKQFFNGDEDNPENPFERVQLTTINKQDKEESNDLEFVVKTLCRGKNKAVVDTSGNGYDCTLCFDETTLQIALDRLQEIGGKATLRPLFAKVPAKELAAEITFDRLALLDLSVFYVLTVSNENDIVRRVLEIETVNLPENREDEIIKKVLNNKECFFRYIAFLLGDDTVIGMLEANVLQLDHEGQGKNGETILPALYEKMLETAANHPEKFKEIGSLLTVLSRDRTDSEISDGTYEQFKQLYETFQKAVK